MDRGIFITFEGIEASGKSTQARMLCDYLTRKGYSPVLTREPGGTNLGRKIRDILLSHTDEIFPPVAELLLYEADRNIHLHNIIKPALDCGSIVVCDRFFDSTTAYQHYGRGIDLNIVRLLNSLASEGLNPDITFLLDLDVEVAFSRLKEKDRMESQGIEFYRKVREGFLELARMYPERIVVIDATMPAIEVHSQIVQVTCQRFDL